MSIKEENEITVKVNCSKEKLLKCLINEGFKEKLKFSLDDYYYIPNNLEIQNMSTREILSKAIIMRYIVNNGKVVQKITFKIKNIADNGDIIRQQTINCDILNIEDAKKLFEALGY